MERLEKKKKLFQFEKWDGYGMEVPLDMIKKYLTPKKTFSTALSLKEKIVKHNVPHGEIFHKCSDSEWQDLLNYIKNTFGIDVG